MANRTFAERTADALAAVSAQPVLRKLKWTAIPECPYAWMNIRPGVRASFLGHALTVVHRDGRKWKAVADRDVPGNSARAAAAWLNAWAEDRLREAARMMEETQ